MLAGCSHFGDAAFALRAVPRNTKVEFSCVAAVASMPLGQVILLTS